MKTPISPLQIVVRIIFVALLLAVGVGVKNKLVNSRPKAKRSAPENRGLLVEAQTFARKSLPMPVQANGVVRPARTLNVMPQVGGRVIARHEALPRMGVLNAGDTLLQIERTDYDARISLQKAAVARAQQALAVEAGRGKVAEREWRLVGRKNADEGSKARALREPQRRSAVADVEAAKANLRLARADAARTKVVAPFNAVVLDSKLEVGQVVGPNATVAQLAGTDAFWIEARVPVSALRWLRTAEDAGSGSTVTIRHDRGADVVVREGQVERILSALDPAGRMARVLIRVDDPLALHNDKPALHLDSFVDVEISGRTVEDVMELPRLSVREGNTVWLADSDNQLEIRPITIAAGLRDTVLVSGGITPEDRVITSRLSSPVPGQKLRIKTPGAAAPEGSPKGRALDDTTPADATPPPDKAAKAAKADKAAKAQTRTPGQSAESVQ